MTLTRRQANLAGFLACAVMMGFAFYAQYVLRLTPCNMCYLQRVGVVALGLAFLLAGLHDPGRLGAAVYGVVIGAVGLGAAAISARHVWMQMQPLGSLPSCGADFFTMFEIMPPLEAVAKIWGGGGDCQTIQWSLLGLSMPVWVLVGVVAVGAAGASANFLRPGTRPHG